MPDCRLRYEHRLADEVLLLLVDDGHGGPGVEIDDAEDEDIRMLRFDVERFQRRRWKVLRVQRDDDLGARSNRRSDDVSIIKIGQLEPIDERLPTLDEAVWDCFTQQAPSPLEDPSGNVVELFQPAAT